MAGLFDIDPFAADKVESLAAAKLGTPDIYGYYAGLGGRMLGRGLGMAAMGGDPRIEQAAELQASMQTMDPNDPNSMYEIGRKFLASGDYDRALKFFERGEKMSATGNKSQLYSPLNQTEMDALIAEFIGYADNIGVEVDRDRLREKQSELFGTLYNAGNELKQALRQVDPVQALGAGGAFEQAKKEIFNKILGAKPAGDSDWLSTHPFPTGK